MEKRLTMFEKTIDLIYESIGASINEKKRELKLKRKDILDIPRRVTDIVKNNHNIHHPYLIGKYEYDALYSLYISEDKKSFFENKKKVFDNYDKMLWQHIDWDIIFKSTITELSTLDLSNELGRIFDSTLIDHVPYAVIKYDELHPNYGRTYISPEERKKERENAIYRVYLRHGNKVFKQTFLEIFTGCTLNKFDIHFNEFVTEYLKKKKVQPYSLGLQAYNLHKNLSIFKAYWQSLDEVQYSDMYKTPSDFSKKLEEYLRNGREQLQKLKKYQQEFDSFDVEIK